jgi:hypothetical protein
LAAAYVDGQAVVRRVFETGGWASVNALYTEPPPSTHALLAPDFPRAPGTPPRPPAAPSAPALPPADDWSLAANEVLGEQALRTILEEWAPSARAFELAQGWQYDRLSLFERGQERALLWEISTDVTRAEAAAEVLRAELRLPTPSAASGRASTPACRAHRDGGVVGLWRRGQILLLGALGDVPRRVGCAALVGWAKRLPTAAVERSTRVPVASSVLPDPTAGGR